MTEPRPLTPAEVDALEAFVVRYSGLNTGDAQNVLATLRAAWAARDAAFAAGAMAMREAAARSCDRYASRITGQWSEACEARAAAEQCGERVRALMVADAEACVANEASLSNRDKVRIGGRG